MRYTFRTIKVKRGKGFTFTVVSRDRGVVPCWPESNRATRNVKLDGFLNCWRVGSHANRSISLGKLFFWLVIRFRRCGREFSMRDEDFFFFKKKGGGE